jgi:hypothetical protein
LRTLRAISVRRLVSLMSISQASQVACRSSMAWNAMPTTPGSPRSLSRTIASAAGATRTLLTAESASLSPPRFQTSQICGIATEACKVSCASS